MEASPTAEGTTLARVADDALAYLQRHQLPDGSIVVDPNALIFQEWDSVNALNAIALWRDDVTRPVDDTVDGVLDFLRSRENSSGMLSWGELEIGPAEYCTETSSEYATALARLGRPDEARRKATYLRSRQLPSGPWTEVHPHIPKAFQTAPSVTGFALMALLRADVEPLHLQEALDFLADAQHAEGHFGTNWYYYNTHYYLLRPAIESLAALGHYAPVAAARDWVLAQQRDDGSWFSEVEGFGGGSSPEQHTALALETLLHAGLRADAPAVRRSVAWLLERRRVDGSWDGGEYPYPETASYSEFQASQDIFATAQVLSALRNWTNKGGVT
jgi:hypothetical protein